MAKAETKFTPGPWKHTGETGDGKYQTVVSVGDDGWHRCSAAVETDDCDYDMGVANARLIAAAPDLYAVVKLVKERRYANFTLTEWHQIDAALSRVEQPQ